MEEPLSQVEFEYENYDLTIEELKDLIYEEILLHHDEKLKKNYEDCVENN